MLGLVFTLFACSAQDLSVIEPSLRWEASLRAPARTLVATADQMLAITEADTLEAVNADGEVVWRWASDQPITGVIQDFGAAIAVAGLDTLVWLDAGSGRPLRTRPIPEGHTLTRIDERSFVRVGPRLHRCELSQQTELRCRAISETAGWEHASVHDGGVFASAGPRLSRREGLDWDLRVHGNFSSRPAFDGATVLAASADGNVYARYADDGSERWTFTPGAPVDGGLAIHDHLAYFAAADDYLYAIQTSNGGLRWRALLDGSSVGTPAPSDDQLLFTTHDGRVHAIDRYWATPLWTFDARESITAGPVMTDGAWVISTTDARLVAVDPPGNEDAAYAPARAAAEW